MYESHKIAEMIKSASKEKNIQIKIMLNFLGLNKNTLSSMYNGSMIKCDSLAKIADYLGCSVDYLLGRVGESQTEKDKKIIAPFEIEDDNRQKLLSNYDKLNDDGQSKLLDYSADLVSGGRYVKNNQLFGAKEA